MSFTHANWHVGTSLQCVTQEFRMRARVCNWRYEAQTENQVSPKRAQDGFQTDRQARTVTSLEHTHTHAHTHTHTHTHTNTHKHTHTHTHTNTHTHTHTHTTNVFNCIVYTFIYKAHLYENLATYLIFSGCASRVFSV